MRRPARLQSAQAWLASGADVTVRTYARRYGVDRYTAYDELALLGVTLQAKDEQWAVRPPPVSKARKQRKATTQDAMYVSNDGLDCWMEWGGQRMFVVGYTPGGAPYGLTEEEWDRVGPAPR
jgi:hypothetical protein